MKNIEVDGVNWDELDSSTKIKAIIIVSSIIIIPLLMLFILISNTSIINKTLIIIMGAFFARCVTITKREK